MKKITTIISDLDNTLWKGIIAEKQKPKLNKEYYEFLKSLHKKGIQIIIVSKNDENDVKKAFKTLKIDEKLFTVIITNWDPKYTNIERILQQTNIRPETVIFIDDSPFERTEVKTKLPKINCLDIVNWEALKNNSYLKEKKNQPKSEIQERINRYKTAISASKLKKGLGKESEKFLKSLKRELSIGEISGENLDRFTQLLVSTHRINFNPDKFKDYDKTLDYLYKQINKGYRLFAISTRENNVSLGLTGAIVVNIQKNKAFVEDGTFSCGIIGRDFEQKAILALIDILKKEKITKMEFSVTLTSTNKRVREIFGELGFKIKQKGVYSVDIKDYKPKKYDWIKLLSTPPEMKYTGHPSAIKFLNKFVMPVMEKNFKVVNLGSSQGEVIGHFDKSIRKEFYDFIGKLKIDFKKVDMEYYPEEKNIVANAEDLRKVFKDETQDLVMAIELLEHAEHFWKIINEMIRICKIKGYIFITIPSYHYPKHEYPIDLWRIGPKTLASFFPKPYFKIEKLEVKGSKETPIRTMILVKKLKKFRSEYDLPSNGKTDWRTGLTIFP